MIELGFYHNPKAKHYFRLLLLLLLTLLLSSSNFASALTPEEASTMIQTGENALASTFENVLSAESLGANVSHLIQKLNEATDILKRAQVALETGMLNDVLNLATQAIKYTDEVFVEAERLSLSKLVEGESAFRFNLILMIVGISGFSFFMLLLWRTFKGYYLQRVLNSKPEVSEVVEP